MKKFITTLLLFCVSLSYAQYSHLYFQTGILVKIKISKN